MSYSSPSPTVREFMWVTFSLDMITMVPPHDGCFSSSSAAGTVVALPSRTIVSWCAAASAVDRPLYVHPIGGQVWKPSPFQE